MESSTTQDKTVHEVITHEMAVVIALSGAEPFMVASSQTHQ